MDRDFVKLAYAIGYRHGLEKTADFSQWLDRHIGQPIDRAGVRFSDAGAAAMQRKFNGLGPARPQTAVADSHSRTAPGAYITQQSPAPTFAAPVSDGHSRTAPLMQQQAPQARKPGMLPADRSGYLSKMSPTDIGINISGVRFPQPKPFSVSPAQVGRSSPAQQLQAPAQPQAPQQPGADILRGMMKSPQGMRDVAQRYKTDSSYAQMLRNAHKSMYGKDDAYTAWYDNWKAQRQAKQQAQTPVQPATNPRRFVVDYRDRPENQGGVFRRMLPSVRQRVANPRMVEVGNDRANEAAVW